MLMTLMVVYWFATSAEAAGGELLTTIVVHCWMMSMIVPCRQPTESKTKDSVES